MRLLEKKGYVVAVAGNGQEALTALERQPFDLVLMDLQMPVMDGLEATVGIREREKGTGRHLPIIALTAHTLKEDRDRCMAAGMDDYVMKPIQPQELYRAIVNCASKPANATVPSALNWDALRERVAGSEEILQEIVEVFLAECPRWLADLHAAVARADAEHLQRAAQQLFASLDTFEYTPATDAALQLMEMGRSGDLVRAAATYACLEKAVQDLNTELSQFLARRK
jgi:CheY-like chemotaxis protein